MMTTRIAPLTAIHGPSTSVSPPAISPITPASATGTEAVNESEDGEESRVDVNFFAFGNTTPVFEPEDFVQKKKNQEYHHDTLHRGGNKRFSWSELEYDEKDPRYDVVAAVKKFGRSRFPIPSQTASSSVFDLAQEEKNKTMEKHNPYSCLNREFTCESLVPAPLNLASKNNTAQTETKEQVRRERIGFNPKQLAASSFRLGVPDKDKYKDEDSDNDDDDDGEELEFLQPRVYEGESRAHTTATSSTIGANATSGSTGTSADGLEILLPRVYEGNRRTQTSATAGASRSTATSAGGLEILLPRVYEGGGNRIQTRVSDTTTTTARGTTAASARLLQIFEPRESQNQTLSSTSAHQTLEARVYEGDGATQTQTRPQSPTQIPAPAIGSPHASPRRHAAAAPRGGGGARRN
ncbi:hypothetical protein F5Y17DRAFT_283298 [Xylariaceae sp. FL0594]|nr:hypothetical protein F5Y17DRAFT_283298 [Xylariaceae sp. FL0594]